MILYYYTIHLTLVTRCDTIYLPNGQPINIVNVCVFVFVLLLQAMVSHSFQGHRVEMYSKDAYHI